jgi:propionate CoA-transferase
LEQVSFSGKLSLELGHEVYYVTERAVFKNSTQGLELVEIAPGIDLERNVIAQMEFRPHISPDLKLMDDRIFHDVPMGLAGDLAKKPISNIPSRLRESEGE